MVVKADAVFVFRVGGKPSDQERLQCQLGYSRLRWRTTPAHEAAKTKDEAVFPAHLQERYVFVLAQLDQLEIVIVKTFFFTRSCLIGCGIISQFVLPLCRPFAQAACPPVLQALAVNVVGQAICIAIVTARNLLL